MKFAIFVLIALFGMSFASPLQSYEIDAELAQKQIESAKYAFSTDIKDSISDLTQERSEVRDGKTVNGHYAYSDGNIKYIVHYIADENGFRVVKQESERLPGPKVNPIGTASIETKTDNSELHYRVQSIPIPNGTLVVKYNNL